jgi:hypothetical protein
MRFITMDLTDVNMSRAAVIARQTEPETQLGWDGMATVPFNAPGIEILPMCQRSEIKDGKEDWTGKSSTSERRKLQNRLNQRAYRRLHDCENSPNLLIGTNPQQDVESSRKNLGEKLHPQIA